jgi:hypothetical protein
MVDMVGLLGEGVEEVGKQLFEDGLKVGIAVVGGELAPPTVFAAAMEEERLLVVVPEHRALEDDGDVTEGTEELWHGEAVAIDGVDGGHMEGHG